MTARRYALASILAATWILAPSTHATEAEAPQADAAYIVQPGDTLSGIASAYLTHLQDYRIVQRRNRIIDPRRMRSGSTLTLPGDLLRTEPVVARLGAYRGAVSITQNGRAITVEAGAILGEGMVIVTGANAFARVDLADGTRMALPSQSQVRINTLRRTVLTNSVGRVFSVEAGRGNSTVTPMKNDRDTFIVRTPLSVSAVRGTEFRVHYDPDQHTAATEVVKGTVLVASSDGAAPVAVEAGFGLNADPARPFLPSPLLPPPSLLRPDQTSDGAALELDVAPADQAQAYRTQLSADAGFLDMIAETTNPGPHIVFGAVPDGTYFIRLSVIGADGLEGLPATYAINREMNTLTLRSTTASEAERQRRYLFRWEASGEGSRTYRFQLMRDQNPRPVIDEAGLAEPKITVTDLPPGLYAWRVMSRTIHLGHQIDKWTAAQSFHVGG